MGSSLGVMTQANQASPDITPPEGDKETARLLGERVARITAQFLKGK
jgi:NAD(P)H dehydrogenase (quinone)